MEQKKLKSFLSIVQVSMLILSEDLVSSNSSKKINNILLKGLYYVNKLVMHII